MVWKFPPSMYRRQGVEGQKNAEFERNQRKKLEPHKNCPLHISHGYQKQFYSATPQGDRQYYMDHIAKHLLPQTIQNVPSQDYFLLLLDNLYGIVNDFGLNHKLRNTAESYQERTNNPRVLERICTCHFLGKGNCSSV